jgi:hypothetical protein
MQQAALVEGSHLADYIMRGHNTSLHTAIHDFKLEIVSYSPRDVYQEELTM